MIRYFATSTFFKVTEAAASRLKELIKEKGENDIGVKIGVRKRGCNGLSYTMEYMKEKSRTDEIVEVEGVKVAVDAKAQMFVIGTTMDYINTPLQQEFVFNNPNAKGTCGCGESFNV
jgi:iron-sulfur cluster assembly protein